MIGCQDCLPESVEKGILDPCAYAAGRSGSAYKKILIHKNSVSMGQEKAGNVLPG